MWHGPSFLNPGCHLSPSNLFSYFFSSSSSSHKTRNLFLFSVTLLHIPLVGCAKSPLDTFCEIPLISHTHIYLSIHSTLLSSLLLILDFWPVLISLFCTMFNNASSRHSQPPSLPSPSLGVSVFVLSFWLNAFIDWNLSIFFLQTRRFRTIVLFDDYNTHPDYHYMADIDSHRTKTNEMLQRNAEFWSGLRCMLSVLLPLIICCY